MSTSQFCLSKKALLSVLFVLICLPIAGLAQSKEQYNDPDKAFRMNFDFQDAALKSVLKNLGKQLGVDVVFEESVKNAKVTFRRTDVTMETMIKEILVEYRLQARMTEAKEVVIFADTEENRARYDSTTSWPQKAGK